MGESITLTPLLLSALARNGRWKGEICNALSTALWVVLTMREDLRREPLRRTHALRDRGHRLLLSSSLAPVALAHSCP